ncbi:putative ribonuclease H-like domain-containing protein [Tanacetum coccineum]
MTGLIYTFSINGHQCFRVLLLSSSAPILSSRVPCIPPPIILISFDSTLSSKMPCLMAIVALKNKGYKAYLAEFQDFNGGPVAFGGSKGYITGKGKIKTGKLDFEDVCFVKELQHFNLFFVSQMCDKKNKVLFTDSECLVLSPEFKLPDENQVLLKIPRQNNMYSFNLENIVPSGGLACLIAKATIDESNKWYRRLGHVNFKNLNKLVKGNLVRGLPSLVLLVKKESNTRPPVRPNQFSWVFFLRTKDETSGILKDFIRQIENQLNQKVKTIRCDNELSGTDHLTKNSTKKSNDDLLEAYEDFISIGSAEDERLIKKMNEKEIDSSKNEMVKEEDKEEEGTKKRKGGHIKMIARNGKRNQSDVDNEIMEKKSVIARLNKVSSPNGDYLVIYRANRNFKAFNYLMEVLHIFDRLEDYDEILNRRE